MRIKLHLVTTYWLCECVRSTPWYRILRNHTKAATWQNEADNKKFFDVSFALTDMDDAKQYHDTDSFGRDDLPLVAELADHAHSFIFEQRAKLEAEQSE